MKVDERRAIKEISGKNRDQYNSRLCDYKPCNTGRCEVEHVMRSAVLIPQRKGHTHTLRVVPVDVSEPVSQRVKTLWLREDCAFIAVLATLRDLCATTMMSSSSLSPSSRSSLGEGRKNKFNKKVRTDKN